jgi:hypothetical protein
VSGPYRDTFTERGCVSRCKHVDPTTSLFDCDAVLRSPFPPWPADPDGLEAFARSLGDETGIACDAADVARAFALAMGWQEIEDTSDWCCPTHAEGVTP